MTDNYEDFPRKKRNGSEGFTLVEVLVAVLIFSLVITGLAAIYATSQRYLSQSFKQNLIKGEIAMAAKTVTRALNLATRIDSPASGQEGDTLAFAVNIAEDGCRPMVSGPPTEWYYFCAKSKGVISGIPRGDLYMHSGSVTDVVACPANSPTSITYSVGSCGDSSGKLILKDMSCDPVSGCNWVKRNAPDGEGANDIKIKLTVEKNPSATESFSPFKTSAETVIHVGMPTLATVGS
ncbi:MAG: type II secretion system protein [bacterium]